MNRRMDGKVGDKKDCRLIAEITSKKNIEDFLNCMNEVSIH